MDTVVIFCAKYLIFLLPIAVVMYVALSPRRTVGRFLALAAVSLPVAYGMGELASALYYNARPFVVSGVAPLIEHAANNGFPSSHMLLAATLATLLFVHNRQWGTVVWILAFVVGAARVVASVHHTLDIVVSACIAVFVVTFVHMLLRKTTWYK